MKTQIALLCAVLLASTVTFAASPEATPVAKPAVKPTKDVTYVTDDNSNELLINKEATKKIWVEKIPAKVAKAYSPKKFGFSTEVDGGFTDNNICVVTARVVLMPLDRLGKTMLYKPVKVTSTIGASTTATKDQCAALAQQKLSESVHAMIVALGG